MLRIKELIRDSGITGKEFAKKLGVTENSLSLIINEKRQPRYETLKEIADLLNVDIRDLFVPTKPGKEFVELYSRNQEGDFEKFGTLVKEVYRPKGYKPTRGY